jgi:hypothetical protein
MTETKLKKKQKKDKKSEVKFDVGESFDAASAKEKDFDLDLEASRFQGKKGQAGTRSKSSG